MKIVPKGNGIFEFHLDVKFTCQSKNFEEAKKHLLEFIESDADRELERIFIEFGKTYYANLDKKDN